MRDPRFYRFLVVILLSLGPSCTDAKPMYELLQQAQQERSYRAALPIEITRARTLFERTLKGEESLILKQEWLELGYTLQTVVENKRTFLTLVEAHNAKFGRGFYLFNLRPQIPLALQAPHSFRDLHTEELAIKLSLQHDVAASAWNTVPRSFRAQGMSVHADMAHLTKSYFRAFSQAFATVYPAGTVLQLHGFSQQKRKTSAGARADVIISSGSKIPSPIVLAAGHCLKQRMVDTEVYIYPQDVSELGGTKNTVAQSLREVGHTGFVHLELSKQLREDLIKQSKLRHLIIDCLSSTIQ